MTDRGIKRLPVVNDMHIFKGMISRADLLKEGIFRHEGLNAHK